ncbi:hypothetical protein H5410_049693 [Solanum commersonii]|uniref:Uncharacterized protein n=1 Tax=Solanum commersonii TaxID=4109 RepID=A0A9J5WTK3_SOLCO|nr:hypothetical protein H5410_049693 [Solanum commersonii]
MCEPPKFQITQSGILTGSSRFTVQSSLLRLIIQNPNPIHFRILRSDLSDKDVNGKDLDHVGVVFTKETMMNLQQCLQSSE